jgi:uncharacterized repeat protein (TIGR01451 family)
LSLAAIALLTIVACTESSVKPPPTAPKVPNGPNLAADVPFNDQGNCIGEDYAAGGGGGSITETKGCTANDIAVGRAELLEYSFDGTTYFPFTGATVECDAGSPVFLRIRAFLVETATSTRSDIGVWVANNGGTARRKVPPPPGAPLSYGLCNHYNLAPAPAYTPPNYTVLDGVTNVDNDQCGDMFPTAATADSAKLELGVLDAVCQGKTSTDTLVHVGSCLSWTVPGGDRVCPTSAGGPTGFRLGTLPSASSKCNCDGFDVPITIRQSAYLEIVKACTPSNDPGTFDLLIDGSNQYATGVGCGGSTGKRTVGAGTSSSPGASHTFGEAAAGTTSLSNYASSFACKNRSDNSTHTSSGTVTSGSITLQPNEDVICTITNVRNTGTVELKKVWSGTAGQTTLNIGTSAGGSEVKSQLTGAAGAAPLTTGAQTVNTGTYYVSETGGLTDYSSTLACTDNGQSVTPGQNNSVSVTTGHAIVCTFTNTRNQGTVELKKVWSGTASQTTLNIGTSAGGSQVASQLTGAAGAAPLTTGTKTVNTGTYYVSESGGLTGYGSSLACTDNGQAVTPGANNSVSVTTGHAVICTFTNTRDTGTIELKKVWSGTAGQTTLNIGTSAGGSQVATQQTGAAGAAPLTTGAQTVNTGTYYVSETGGLTDYSSSLACTDNGQAVTPGANNSVSVTTGHAVVCTFTNTRNQGTIELKKVWVGGGGQTTLNIGTSAGGTQTATQQTGAAGAAPLTTGAQTVNTGTYYVSETGGLTDYNTSLACTDNGQAVTPGANNSLSVTTGHTVVCTFTNTLKPFVKLVKAIVPSNDAGKFDLTIAGTTYNNSGSGYGDQGTTGFKPVSIGSVSISESAHTGTTLSEYASTLACLNKSGQTVTVSSNTGTSGSITTVAGDSITCTFTNNHQPKLTITKTPDAGGTGYNVSPGGTATFTVTISNASNAGPAFNVQLIDTLPAGVGDWTENPDKADCTIAAFPNAGDPKRLLTCSGGVIGTLDPGESFTVIVQATVPNNFLQLPPSNIGLSPIDIDGNLLAGAGRDWQTLNTVSPILVDCTTNPKKGCDIDKPTGSTDDSFGQGTSEDDAVPTVVTGSIPNNKSDLLRFYVATERINVTDWLYLAWERVQAPNGTTNMDFELNQDTLLSGNGVTPRRTEGDILIKYDLSQGGTNPVLGFHRWILSGTCEKNGGKAPCWGPGQVLSAAQGVIGAINHLPADDPINPNATRTLDSLTFGEARIDLETSGIFQAGACLSFGSAYLKSRSSDSFTAEIKDFIAPIRIAVTNCAPKNLDNRAWARASNFAPAGGNLNDWFSDTGQIHVSDASGTTGFLLDSPASRRLALVPAVSGVATGNVVGDQTVAVSQRGATFGARQPVGAPWPPSAAEPSPGRSVPVASFAPRSMLVT